MAGRDIVNLIYNINCVDLLRFQGESLKSQRQPIMPQHSAVAYENFVLNEILRLKPSKIARYSHVSAAYCV
jgi:hypothetical protein